MKKYISFCFAVLYITIFYSQENKTTKGPIIKDFGQVYKIKNPDLLLDKNKKYKIIFDVYTDSKNTKKQNASINTVARFLNMHAQNNIRVQNLDIVLVLHGAATKNVISDKAFQREFKMNNPNTKLIKALDKANVKVYVCGQSFAHKGYERSDLSKNVALSLSALTALVEYQSKGYQLITFN
ncbi:MAG: DsrE family protein [Flavobacteriaceae bacterium]|nr:DsrE family protein [Flavobacteriaceae bacterium]